MCETDIVGEIVNATLWQSLLCLPLFAFTHALCMRTDKIQIYYTHFSM